MKKNIKDILGVGMEPSASAKGIFPSLNDNKE